MVKISGEKGLKRALGSTVAVVMLMNGGVASAFAESLANEGGITGKETVNSAPKGVEGSTSEEASNEEAHSAGSTGGGEEAGPSGEGEVASLEEGGSKEPSLPGAQGVGSRDTLSGEESGAVLDIPKETTALSEETSEGLLLPRPVPMSMAAGEAIDSGDEGVKPFNFRATLVMDSADSGSTQDLSYTGNYDFNLKENTIAIKQKLEGGVTKLDIVLQRSDGSVAPLSSLGIRVESSSCNSGCVVEESDGSFEWAVTGAYTVTTTRGRTESWSTGTAVFGSRWEVTYSSEGGPGFIPPVHTGIDKPYLYEPKDYCDNNNGLYTYNLDILRFRKPEANFTWSIDESGRAVATVDAGETWKDGTTDPVVFEVPADEGKDVAVPSPESLKGAVVDGTGVGDARWDGSKAQELVPEGVLVRVTPAGKLAMSLRAGYRWADGSGTAVKALEKPVDGTQQWEKPSTPEGAYTGTTPNTGFSFPKDKGYVASVENGKWVARLASASDTWSNGTTDPVILNPVSKKIPRVSLKDILVRKSGGLNDFYDAGYISNHSTGYKWTLSPESDFGVEPEDGYTWEDGGTEKIIFGPAFRHDRGFSVPKPYMEQDYTTVNRVLGVNNDTWNLEGVFRKFRLPDYTWEVKDGNLVAKLLNPELDSWEDGTTEDVNLGKPIDELKTVEIPSISPEVLSSIWKKVPGPNNDLVDISKLRKNSMYTWGYESGEIKATLTIPEESVWSDGTTEPKVIGRITDSGRTINVPVVDSSWFPYVKIGVFHASWVVDKLREKADELDLRLVVKETSSGPWVKLALKSPDDVWSDGTREDKTLNPNHAVRTITLPDIDYTKYQKAVRGILNDEYDAERLNEENVVEGVIWSSVPGQGLLASPKDAGVRIDFHRGYHEEGGGYLVVLHDDGEVKNLREDLIPKLPKWVFNEHPGANNNTWNPNGLMAGGFRDCSFLPGGVCPDGSTISREKDEDTLNALGEFIFPHLGSFDLEDPEGNIWYPVFSPERVNSGGRYIYSQVSEDVWLAPEGLEGRKIIVFLRDKDLWEDGSFEPKVLPAPDDGRDIPLPEVPVGAWVDPAGPNNAGWDKSKLQGGEGFHWVVGEDGSLRAELNDPKKDAWVGGETEDIRIENPRDLGRLVPKPSAPIGEGSINNPSGPNNSEWIQEGVKELIPEDGFHWELRDGTLVAVVDEGNLWEDETEGGVSFGSPDDEDREERVPSIDSLLGGVENISNPVGPDNSSWILEKVKENNPEDGFEWGLDEKGNLVASLKGGNEWENGGTDIVNLGKPVDDGRILESPDNPGEGYVSQEGTWNLDKIKKDFPEDGFNWSVDGDGNLLATPDKGNAWFDGSNGVKNFGKASKNATEVPEKATEVPGNFNDRTNPIGVNLPSTLPSGDAGEKEPKPPVAGVSVEAEPSETKPSEEKVSPASFKPAEATPVAPVTSGVPSKVSIAKEGLARTGSESGAVGSMALMLVGVGAMLARKARKLRKG